MGTHSNILAWKIPWIEEPGGGTVHRVTRVGHNLASKPPPPMDHRYNWKMQNYKTPRR